MTETSEGYDNVFNVLKSTQDYKAHKRRIQIEWTPTFCWWIFPTIEINSSMKEVAFYFLCFSAYFNWDKTN